MTDVHPLAHPLSVAARPELTGGRSVGVLLSHGFTGSPVSMKPWGEYLAEQGYAVEVPRLPGHGTSWQEMNKTTWADWYGEVSRAYEKLAAENDVVVACGLSMGGALVLQLAADHPEGLAGVVVVNPAVATKRKDVKLLPVLKHLVPSFPGIASDIK
ncbi:MAG: alpha/beta hydrolase, partial [Nocardioides sp.]